MMLLLLVVSTFSLLFTVTLVVPQLLPGPYAMALIQQWTGIPEVTGDIAGVSIERLLTGCLNGGLASGCAAVCYGMVLYFTRAHAPESASRPPDPSKRSVPTQRLSRNDLSTTQYAIEDILGIGPTYGQRLRALQITEIAYLLTIAATPADRQDLADDLDISPVIVEKWVRQADFLRIHSIGPHYAQLLEASGVTSIQDLAHREATLLHSLLQITNHEKALVQRAPPLTLVQTWIRHAQHLPPCLIEQLLAAQAHAPRERGVPSQVVI